jgi:hypothetical protein
MLKDMEKIRVIKDATNPSNLERVQAIKALRDDYLAALMLSSSNRDKFGPLCMDLKNQFGFGEDQYPKTIDQCLSLLNRWGHTPPASSNSPCIPGGAQTSTHDPKPEEALVFVQGSSSKKPSAKKNPRTPLPRAPNLPEYWCPIRLRMYNARTVVNWVILPLCALTSHNPSLFQTTSMLRQILTVLLR